MSILLSIYYGNSMSANSFSKTFSSPYEELLDFVNNAYSQIEYPQ